MKITSLLFLTFAQVISVFLLTYFLSPIQMVVLLIAIGVLGVVYNVLKPLGSFALLVSIVIGLGFLFSGSAWVLNWDNGIQIEAIGTHILLALLLGSLWVQVYLAKKYKTDYLILHSKVLELMKYEDQQKLLTYNELSSRLKVLYTGLQRRKEQGYIIIVEIKLQDKEFGLKTIYRIVSEAAIESIRNDYDLVGKLTDHKIVIVLQNTDEVGLDIVNNRFKEKLQNGNVPLEYINISSQQMVEEWYELENMLSNEVTKELMVG
jgi:hypothetical protein